MRKIKKLVENRLTDEQENILEFAFDKIMEIQFTKEKPISGANLTIMLGQSIGSELNKFFEHYFDTYGRELLMQGIKKYIY